MQPTKRTEGRYQAQPGNPPTVYDLLLEKTSSTHITFESAVARSWTLNRFSTGLCAAVILFCSVAARAESLPDTKVHFADYVSYSAIATYRTLDYTSTRKALSLGGRERVLPQFVVKSSPTLAAYEGLATAAEISGSVWLIHHHHRKMARVENAFSIGIGSAVVAHNYSLGRTK